MLNNQESLTKLDHDVLSQKQNDQTEPSKQSVPTSNQTDTENLRQKGENINDTTLQHTTQHHKSRDVAAGLIWQEDQGQESQKQDAQDLSGVQEDSQSGDEQFVQDEYPSDYDADQDTYFQKSIKQIHSSQKDQQDSEWPQPLAQISLKQSQDEEAPAYFSLQKIEIQRYMTSQQFMDFINKNYLKKLNDHQQEGDSEDEEKLKSKIKKSNNSKHKKVMFKDCVSIKRFKENDQVHLITLVPEEIQYLNIPDKPKSPVVQHQAPQISQTIDPSKDEKKCCESDTKLEQSKTLDQVESTKYQQQQALKAQYNQIDLKADEKENKAKPKAEQPAQKAKLTQNMKVSTYKQKQNFKQNYEKQDLALNPKKETHLDEDKYIEIWSSLQGRAVKLIK